MPCRPGGRDVHERAAMPLGGHRSRAATLLQPPADNPLGMDADQGRGEGDRLAPPADLDGPRTPGVRALQVVDDDRCSPRARDVAELLGPLELTAPDVD